MHRLRTHLYYFVPPLLWMGIIYYMSSQSRISITTVYVTDLILFKSLHMIEYALLFFLWYRALFRYLLSIPHAPEWGALFIASSYAVTDELHQLGVSTRQGRLSDVLIDMIGILIMYTVVKSTQWLKRLL